MSSGANFSISNLDLAAKGHGLKSFSQVANQVVEVIKNPSNNKTCFTTHSLVLGLITLLAAALATYLLYISGGPSNLTLFVTGVVAGTVALLSVVGIAIRSATYVRKQTTVENDLKKDVVMDIPLDDFLPEMLDTTRDGKIRTRNTLDNLTSPTRLALVEALYQKFYVDSQDALGNGEKELLVLCGSYIDVLNETDLTGKSREFAALLLEGGETHLRESNKVLSSKFLNVLGDLTQHEAEIFAAYPALSEYRPFAIAILKKLPVTHDQHVVHNLFDTVGTPQNPEEANLLTRFQVALIAYTSNSSYAWSLLQHSDLSINDAVLRKLFKMAASPRTEKEAETLNRFPAALYAYIRDTGNEYGQNVLKYLNEKNRRPCALEVFKLIGKDANPELLQTLLGYINEPENELEAALISQHPQALEKKMEESGRPFCKKMYEHLPVAAHANLLTTLADVIGAPKNEDEAKLLAKHAKTLISKIEASDREYALTILNQLKTESVDESILTALFLKLGTPRSPEEANKFAAYPASLTKLIITQGNTFILPLLQLVDVSLLNSSSQVLGEIATKVNVKDAKVAFQRHPEALSHLVVIAPKTFTTQVVSTIFAQMSSEAKAIFLKTLREKPTSESVNAALKECVSKLVTDDFMKENAAANDENKALIAELTLLPKLLGEKYRINNPFCLCVYDQMSAGAKTEYVEAATTFINTYATRNLTSLADTYSKWFALPKKQELDSAVLGHNSHAIASALILMSNSGLDKGLAFYETLSEEKQEEVDATYVNLLMSLEDDLPEERANEKTRTLTALINNCPEDVFSFQGRRLIEFFAKNAEKSPDDIRIFLLDKKEEKRDTIALFTLIVLGEKARQPIEKKLDENGWENFNRLAEKMRSLLVNSSEVTENQKWVVHYFYKNRDKAGGLFGDRSIEMEGDAWKQFREIFQEMEIIVRTPKKAPSVQRTGSVNGMRSSQDSSPHPNKTLPRTNSNLGTPVGTPVGKAETKEKPNQ